MDNQLQELIELQKEQNQLLKRYLWRLRFSLLTIMLMMTGVCIGLGFLVYETKSKVAPPMLTFTAPRLSLSRGTITEIPAAAPPATPSAGTYDVIPNPPLPSVNVSEIIK